MIGHVVTLGESAVTAAGWAIRPGDPADGYVPAQAIYATLAYRTIPRLVAYANIFTTDMEVIKEQGTPAYYKLDSYYPEGFRSATATETLAFTNPNSSSVGYQIIAHYETGTRDQVILRGQLAPFESRRISISEAGAAVPDLVRPNTPYALQLQTVATLGDMTTLPIAAVIERQDFGGRTVVPFFRKVVASNLADASNSRPEDPNFLMNNWTFPRVEIREGGRQYVTLMNVTSVDATLSVSLWDNAGNRTTLTAQLGAFRRGGFELDTSRIPAGVYWMSAGASSASIFRNFDGSIVIDEDPIQTIANFSGYVPAQAGVDPSRANTPATGVLGSVDSYSQYAFLGPVENTANKRNLLSIANLGDAADAIVSVWHLGRAANVEPPRFTFALVDYGRVDVSLDDLGIRRGETVSISYRTTHTRQPYSPQRLAAASFSTVDVRNLGLTSGITNDENVIPLSSFTPGIVNFGGLNLRSSNSGEPQSLRLLIFNPYSNSSIRFEYTVHGLFGDGTTIELSRQQVAARSSLAVTLGENITLRNKLGQLGAFPNFGLRVTLSAFSIDGGEVAGFGTVLLSQTLADRKTTTIPGMFSSYMLSSDAAFLP